MSLTTQDLVKGIDLETLETVTASELEQLVDIARTPSDKGLTITTADTDTDVPVVPDPDTDIDGIIPIWWKRYIWIRTVFDGSMNMYVWNTAAVSDATYLKWQSIKVDVTSINAAIVTAQNEAELAHTIASAANVSATLANAAAVAAQTTADTAQTTSDDVQDNLDSGFETPVAGKYQLLAANVIGLSTSYSRLKLFLQRQICFTAASVPVLADTGWIVIDLSSWITQFAGLSAYVNLGNAAVILRVQLKTEIAGATTGAILATAYFAYRNTVAKADANYVSAQLQTLTADTNQAVGYMDLVLPISALATIAYRWESTGVQNILTAHVVGFVAGIDVV